MSATQASGSAAAPAQVLEGLIARCWCEVLGVEGPATDSDFFDQGGNSLQGLELTGKLSELLPFEAPLVALFFDEPTIAGFTRAIADEVGPEDMARLCRGQPPA